MEGEMMRIMRYWMEGEITSFIKIWLTAYVSLSYCYFSGKMLPKGAARLAAFLPVVCLFVLLPLQLHSAHLVGTTGFFLTWLTTFKVLMFAFNKGPLSTPSISLPRFIAVASLPIIDYEDYIHPRIIVVLYCFHIYLCLEIMLAVAAAAARLLLAAELEPQFNEPYLSTSLQDFWGRRWNLMVTRILRPTVYFPVLDWSTEIVGSGWAPLPAVMSTFLVSGLMHELIFYYFGRVKPTWEITWFFLLHGACVMVEMVVKKAVDGRWRLPRVVGTVLTAGFVLTTGLWLFFPQMLRCKVDERGLAEIAAVGAFVKDVVRALSSTFNS